MDVDWGVPDATGKFMALVRMGYIFYYIENCLSFLFQNKTDLNTESRMISTAKIKERD